MKVFGVDIEGVLTKDSLDGAVENPSILSNARYVDGAAALFTTLVMEHGWVPSIITDLDTSLIPFLDVWLARGNIPYSNFLAGVTFTSDALLWTGCTTYICSKPRAFHYALAQNPDLYVYVIKSEENKTWRETLRGEREIFTRIKEVDTLEEIIDMEIK